MVKKILFLCLVLFAVDAVALDVIRVTPSGEDVRNAAEVVIQFDQAVAPLGDAGYKAELFENAIQPQVNCEWRWLAPETISCRLKGGETFTPATHYTITVPLPQLSDEAKDTYAATFTTQRPKVLSNYEDSWKSPVLPTFYVRTNVYVDAKELEKVLSFVSAAKEYAVDAKLDNDGDKLGFYITPREDLPYDSEVSLKIVPGLKGTQGAELGKQDEILRNFRTFGDFKFLGVVCQGEEGKEIIVYDADAEIKCNPMSGFGLAFSAPVKTDGKARFSITPNVYTKEKEQQFFEDLYTSEYHQSIDETHKNIFYTLRTNWLIPANKTYSVQAEKGTYQDIFERPLKAAGKGGFQTGKRQKQIVFDHQYSVLEKGVESHLPIFMTNINELKADYAINTVRGRFLGKKIFNGYPVEDLSYRYPIKVRDLIGTANSESGVIEGYLSTPETKYKDWFFSEVTPFHVHVKLGHFSSLVWVTDFENGKAVQDADVTLLSDKLKGYGLKQQKLASAKTNSDGIAILPGLETIDPDHKLLDTWQVENPMIITKVSKGGDIAVVPSVYRFRLYANVGQWEKAKYGHIKAWGTTTQGIYKAGDPIKYKIFVRNQDNNTFTKAPESGYTLQLIDPMGDLASEVKDVKLSEFGSFSGEFQTAKTAPSGIYRIVLKANFAEKFTWDALTVLVSDFTKAPFKVQNTVEDKVYLVGDDLDFKVEARFHAGGPYAKAPLKINAVVSAKEIRPKDKKFNSFCFDPATEKDEDGNQISPWGVRTLHKEEGVLDASGNFEDSIDVPETTVPYGTLVLESSVQDSRGKDVAARSTATYAARDRYVGLKQKDWIFTAGKEHEIESIVIDQNGEVAEGTAVSIIVKQLDRKAARVKSAGNAYVTKYVDEWNEIYECKGISSSEPFVCKFVPSKSAIYEIIAEIKDRDDRPFKTSLKRFAMGGDFVLWGNDTSPDLEMSSDKNEYRVGETAKVLIKNPYPKAETLFTIERYGIRRHWTKVIEGSSEVVEVPITAADLPGFYLSAVVMSPRIADKPIDENQVDLGKPAFKMGYVQIKVVGDEKRLVTKVTPKQDSYKPREMADVDIAVTDGDGKVVQSEVAVIALDEAVFDLLKDGMSYFDPYKGFYKLESLDVINLNIIESLIGRIAFEKKGTVPAGDGLGGKVEERDEFSNVAYWNPALKLDATGHAKVQFKLPDNLTSWRVIAIAVDTTDKMGVGFSNLKVNLPIEARFALPNQVRDGDDFNAKAVVMNRTDLTKELHAVLSVKQGENVKESELKIEAEPFIQNKIEVPFKVQGFEPISVSVRAETGSDNDAATVKLEVAKNDSTEKQTFYGFLGTDPEKTIKLKFPEDLKQDVGGLTLTASNSLIGSMEGTFTAMRDYPYPCWEQKLSRAVSAAMYLKLKSYLPVSFKWNVDPAAIIAEAPNFQAPNGGMAFFVAKDEHVSEYLSAYTALAFKWLTALGYTVPETVNSRLKEYLKGVLRRDLQNGGPSLRAMIVEALSSDKELAKDELPRLMMQRDKLNLMGLASLLSVASELNDSSKNALLEQILNASDETSGKLTFRDGEALALHSSVRSSCAVLNALLTAPNGAHTEELIQKLVRTISFSKGKKGAWLNTQENVFCAVAMEHYSRLYESTSLAQTLDFLFDGKKLSTLKLGANPGSTVEFLRPFSAEDEGKEAELKISLTPTTGRAYFVAGMEYALNKALPAVNAGFEVVREYNKIGDDGSLTPIKNGDSLKVGDLVRVDLFVTTAGAHSYVALNDPLPAAFETVNTDLATAATLTDNDPKVFDSGSFHNKFSDWNNSWYFYHKELKHEAVRFFADRLPAGRYYLSYTAQVIASGENFKAPASTVEEMYAPDVFGRGDEITLSVNP